MTYTDHVHGSEQCFLFTRTLYTVQVTSSARSRDTLNTTVSTPNRPHAYFCTIQLPLIPGGNGGIKNPIPLAYIGPIN
jgi:hypothetical protein